MLITCTFKASLPKVDVVMKKIQSLSNGSVAGSVRADLRSLESQAQIVSAALALDAGHRIDILVNDAAAELNKPLEEISVDDFTSVYDLNVRAPTLFTKAVLPHLCRPGRIINISLIGARANFASLSVYCSSKAALEGLTRCWAAELGKDGTTVNAVASDPVESDMLANVPKAVVEMQEKSTPVGQRVGIASEIATVVSWLARSESGWIRGQELNVSGGWTMY
jgi:3-oxoacyl-[acyl-carrier protein] reductase